MKKTYFTILCSILASISIFLIIKNANEDEKITRYEWMDMLCEQTGMVEYENNNSYFSDVDKQSSHFKYIQSAVEWDIINSDSKFNGNDYANGEFVALSAMKAIGENKIKLCLNVEDSITDEEYINLAIESELIKRSELKKKVTALRSKEILQKLNELYFGKFFPDNFENVKLKEGVIELEKIDYIYKENNIIKVISEESKKAIKDNSILILEDSSGLKVGRRVIGFLDDELLLEEIEMEEVIEHLNVSDIVEFTFEDIVDYYSLDNSVKTLDQYMVSVSYFEHNSKGIKFEFSVEEEDDKNKLSIKTINKDSGVAWELPIDVSLKKDSVFNGEIDLDKILIAAQMKYENSRGIEYVEVTADADIKFSGKIKHEGEIIKILLGKKKIPLKGGLVGVDVQLFLTISAEGKIEILAEMPFQNSIRYEKGKGIRYYKKEFSLDNAEVDANGEISEDFRLHLIPTILFENVFDAEMCLGITANKERIMQPNGQICVNSGVYFPIITLQVCEDDDIESIVKKLGFSAVWEIVTTENTIFKREKHIEYLVEGIEQIVDKCTYGEKDNINESEGAKEDFIEDGLNNVYYTKYSELDNADCPQFCFNYSDNWTVSIEEVVGDDNNRVLDYYGEMVELINDRGVSIRYMHYKMHPAAVGNGSAYQYLLEYDIKKVGESKLETLNTAEIMDTDVLMVAEIKVKNDENSSISYGILPLEKQGTGTSDIVSFQEVCSFAYPYPAYYSFTAETPDGQFSSEEVEEVIAILSSFRLAKEYVPSAEEEKEIEEDDAIYMALKQGDFSYFAGIYEPCSIYEEDLGKMDNLELKEDGLIIGGGMSYNTNPYPKDIPMSVIKQDDGSYLCQVNYFNESSQNYFIIYPKGVIGDNPYIYNDPILTETPYIHYFSMDGGVMDIIYLLVSE